MCDQALGLALVQRGNMGGRTQLTETGHTLRAYCDKVLAVASEAAQVHFPACLKYLATQSDFQTG